VPETETVETKRHLHRCQNCGVIWGHGDMMAGDMEAHKCPKCGKGEWRVYSGGQSHGVQPRQQEIVLGLRTLITIALMAAAFVLFAQLVGEFIGSLGQKNGG